MKHLILLAAFFVSAVANASVPIERITSYTSDGPETSIVQYPDPKPNQKILVIRETFLRDMRVEVIFSKPALRDTCNNASFDGEFKTQEVPSMSFLNYHELTVGGMSTTLMGCGDNKEVVQDTPVYVEGTFMDASDAIVLYVPSDVKVTYRVWSPGAAKAPGLK